MSAMVERIEASWRDLLAVAEGIPDERLGEPGASGSWSVKDILTHIAYWEDRLVESIERKLAGVPEPASDDVETLNQRAWAERRDWSATQVWDDLRRGHERLLASVRACPSLTDEEVEGDTWGHYAEHAAAVGAWRARAGV